jgi:hypothetical protein
VSTELSNEQLIVVKKVNDALKDRGVSLWHALLSTNMNIEEQSKVIFFFSNQNLKLSLFINFRLMLENLSICLIH